MTLFRWRQYFILIEFVVESFYSLTVFIRIFTFSGKTRKTPRRIIYFQDGDQLEEYSTEEEEEDGHDGVIYLLYRINVLLKEIIINNGNDLLFFNHLKIFIWMSRWMLRWNEWPRWIGNLYRGVPICLISACSGFSKLSRALNTQVRQLCSSVL